MFCCSNKTSSCNTFPLLTLTVTFVVVDSVPRVLALFQFQRGPSMATTILRLPAVQARTGLSRSTIYLHVADGSFLGAVLFGVGAVGWVELEVEGWISGRVLERRGRGMSAQ